MLHKKLQNQIDEYLKDHEVPQEYSRLFESISERYTELEAKVSTVHFGNEIKAIFEDEGKGLIITEKNGSIFEINNQFTNITEYPSSEILGQNLFELKIFDSDFISKFQTEIDQLIKLKQPLFLETKITAKSGQKRDIEIRATKFIVDESKEVLIFLIRDITQRVEVEQAYKKAKLEIENYLNIAEAIFVVIDENEKVTLINRKGHEILGYNHEEILGRNWFDLVAIESEKGRFRKIFHDFISGSTDNLEYLEFDIKTSAGEVKTIAWRTSPLKDDAGKIYATLNFGVDITHHKRIEAELVRKVNLEKLLADASTKFINLDTANIDDEITKTLETLGKFTEVDRVFLFQNDSATLLKLSHKWVRDESELSKEIQLDLDLNEFTWLGRMLKEGNSVQIPRIEDLPPEAGAEIKRLLSDRIKSFALLPLTLASESKGFLALLSVSKNRFWSEDYIKIFEVLGEAMINAIERKRVETILSVKNQDLIETQDAILNVIEDLEKEKEKTEREKVRTQSFLKSIGEGIIAIDSEGHILVWNEAAEKMFGFSFKEVKGKHVESIVKVIGKDEKGNLINLTTLPILLALETGLKQKGEYYYTKKDNTKFPTKATLAPVKVADKIIGVVGVYRDITKEKEIDLAKSEFVSMVSHQLRTPLTAINWYLEMVRSTKTPLSEEVVSYIDEVAKASNKMLGLVNSLLNVSKIELGTFPINPVEMSLADELQNLNKEFDPIIKDKQLNFNITIEENLPNLMADPKLVTMIFQNLISNAVKYTDANDKVEVSLSRYKSDKQEGILFKVVDSGHGIPEDQKSKIFEKMFRADNVKVLDVDGTGLGLYIVKSLIDKFGGKIWFESEIDKGTSFYVLFPYSGMKQLKP